MPERSPFERVFDPDYSGTASGFLGRMFGNPTSQERFGEVQSRAMSEFSNIMKNGNLSPQQGILELLRTPVGQEIFKSGDPNAIKSLSDMVQTVQPPAPTMVGPGQAAVDRSGKVLASQPTQEVQNLKGFQEIAKLPQERLQEIAQIHMLPSEDRKIFALKQILPNDLAVKLGTGVIEVKETKDFFGKPSGQFVVIDKATNSVTPLSMGPGANSNTPSAAPRTEQNPAGIADPNKLNMFLGTGVWPTGLRYLDNVIRSTFSERFGTSQGQTAQQRNRDLKDLEVAIVSFPEVVGRTNKVLDSLKGLLPKTLGPASDSVDAGINIYQMTNREISNIENTLTSNDKFVSSEAKADLSKQRLGYMRILRALPPLEDMLKLKEEIARDGGGSFTAQTGAGAFMELGKNVMTGVKETLTGNQPAQGAQPSAARPRVSAGPTPEQVQGMTLRQLHALDPGSLSPQAKQVVVNRVRELLLKRRQSEVPH